MFIGTHVRVKQITSASSPYESMYKYAGETGIIVDTDFPFYMIKFDDPGMEQFQTMENYRDRWCWGAADLEVLLWDLL